MITTLRKTARISVNKLAEYLEASSTRRKKIVFDAKYPSNYIVTRYKDAREIIKEFLRSRDEDFVLDQIIDLEDKKPETEFQEQDIKLSIESLESLLETDISILDGCELTPLEDECELLNIAGVDVSVNPDILIKKEFPDRLDIGVMKLHITKTTALSEDSQKIVSAMLFTYAETFLASKYPGGDVSKKICFSFDLFNRSIVCCPASIKLRMKQIEAACEEIALWWDKL